MPPPDCEMFRSACPRTPAGSTIAIWVTASPVASCKVLCLQLSKSANDRVDERAYHRSLNITIEPHGRCFTRAAGVLTVERTRMHTYACVGSLSWSTRAKIGSSRSGPARSLWEVPAPANTRLGQRPKYRIQRKTDQSPTKQSASRPFEQLQLCSQRAEGIMEADRRSARSSALRVPTCGSAISTNDSWWNPQADGHRAPRTNSAVAA